MCNISAQVQGKNEEEEEEEEEEETGECASSGRAVALATYQLRLRDD
jgi:hypothetical protein